MGWGCASGAQSAEREPVRTFEPSCERIILGRALVRRVHSLLMPGLYRGLALCAVVWLVRPSTATAQPGFDSIALDRLQIQSLGLSAGWVNPSQLLPAQIYGLQAEYGPVAAGWRASFGVSFWDSRFRDAVVQTFVDSLQKSVSSPTAHVDPSRITVYDVTFGLDLRYTPST